MTIVERHWVISVANVWNYNPPIIIIKKANTKKKISISAHSVYCLQIIMVIKPKRFTIIIIKFVATCHIYKWNYAFYCFCFLFLCLSFIFFISFHRHLTLWFYFIFKTHLLGVYDLCYFNWNTVLFMMISLVSMFSNKSQSIINF